MLVVLVTVNGFSPSFVHFLHSASTVSFSCEQTRKGTCASAQRYAQQGLAGEGQAEALGRAQVDVERVDVGVGIGVVGGREIVGIVGEVDGVDVGVVVRQEQALEICWREVRLTAHWDGRQGSLRQGRILRGVLEGFAS